MSWASNQLPGSRGQVMMINSRPTNWALPYLHTRALICVLEINCCCCCCCCCGCSRDCTTTILCSTTIIIYIASRTFVVNNAVKLVWNADVTWMNAAREKIECCTLGGMSRYTDGHKCGGVGSGKSVTSVYAKVEKLIKLCEILIIIIIVLWQRQQQQLRIFILLIWLLELLAIK